MVAAFLIALLSGLVWKETEGTFSWAAAAVCLFFGAVFMNGLLTKKAPKLDETGRQIINGGSGNTAGSQRAAESVPKLPGNGQFSCEVVGESNYQDALESIAGPKCEDGAEHTCEAIIQHEPNNAYDENACAVKVGSALVGYLPRATAAKLVKVAEKQGYSDGFSYGADAVIRGGWLREDSEGSYGISLDVSPKAFKVSK